MRSSNQRRLHLIPPSNPSHCKPLSASACTTIEKKWLTSLILQRIQPLPPLRHPRDVLVHGIDRLIDLLLDRRDLPRQNRSATALPPRKGDIRGIEVEGGVREV